ncbi:MAG: hypothetical protein JSS86_04765 [Cyanobacteria bacterium SZAS LIN-2]|nr:hypothetical protein [Cyanobacteria bacterium SZAS LIN-2]
MTGDKPERTSRAGLLELLHPFLMAALPVLLLLNFVRDQVLPEEVLPSLIFVEVLALVLCLIAQRIFGNLFKATIAATMLIVFTFSFRLWEAVLGLFFHHIDGLLLVLLFFGLEGLLVFAFLQGKWRNFKGEPLTIDYRRVCIALTIVSAVLLLVNGGRLFVYEQEQGALVEKYKSAMARDFASVKLDSSKGCPDIYYFVLDGYAPPATMVDLLSLSGLTLGKLSDSLSANGFYIAERAAANYDRTEFSLASSLNMQYLDGLVRDGKGPPPCVFMRLAQDSQVLRLLHSLGYKFVLLSSGAFGTDSMSQADKIMRHNYVNHFSRALAYLTPWSRLEQYSPLLAIAMGQTRLAPGKLLQQLEEEERRSERLGKRVPKFVLIHTDLPHTPYLFSEFGGRQRLSPDLIPDWNPPEAYWKQWYFTQTQVAEWVNTVYTASRGEAVIIVQSDHGPGMRDSTTSKQDWFNERMRIFNAYYLPGKKAGLYPAITPVNSFRLVLNQYFDARLPLLKDASYCPADPANTFDWQDVTRDLHFPETGATR